MLQLRPNCEACDKDLAPNAADARICSYECTFCADCVENVLANVCPNCGGRFVPRPIRPATEWAPAGAFIPSGGRRKSPSSSSVSATSNRRAGSGALPG